MKFDFIISHWLILLRQYEIHLKWVTPLKGKIYGGGLEGVELTPSTLELFLNGKVQGVAAIFESGLRYRIPNSADLAEILSRIDAINRAGYFGAIYIREHLWEYGPINELIDGIVLTHNLNNLAGGTL